MAKKSSFSFKTFLKSKKLKYGGYATAVTAVVIAIAIILNIVAGVVETNLGWKFDLTQNKLYSLSTQTKTILKNLKDDITVYKLEQTGSTSYAVTDQILDRYGKESKHVRIEAVDPIKNPTFTQKFGSNKTNIDDGAIIVANKGETKYKVLNYNDLFNYSVNSETNQESVSSIQAEQKITGAMLYVTSAKTPKLYFLQGHGELGVDSTLSYLKSTLENQNFDVQSLNLLTSKSKMESGDVLVIASPKQDITLDERETIKNFMINNGKILFLMDPMKTALPNLESLLQYYDVSLDKDVVVEGDTSHYSQNPAILVPDIESHGVTDLLISANSAVLIPAARSIKLPGVSKTHITVTPLLKTTSNSWAKTNLDSKTAQKESGDLTGPFTVAAAIEKTTTDSDNTSSRIVVIGSSQFISSSSAAGTAGNLDLLVDSISWLKNQKDNVTIQPKSLSTDALRITNQQQVITLTIFLVVVLPIIIFVAGIVVWLRRRHL